MNFSKIKIVTLLLFVGFISACSNSSLYHNYMMRGQVVEKNANEIVVCIGEYDGAEVGQKLSVMRFTPTIAPGEGDEQYDIDIVGEVKVISIINKHFAKVKVISGEIKLNDMVEL